LPKNFGAEAADTKEETVATRATTDRPGLSSQGYRAERDETKRSLLSTEFWAFVACVAAILIAVAQADNFGAPRAWTLIAAVTIGYMVSRGLAKAGSTHRTEDNYDRD
jgi:hypothetical protein